MSAEPNDFGAEPSARPSHGPFSPLDTASAAYYDDAHFAAKQREWRFSGLADCIKFAPFVGKEDRVLDFGCRGGEMLANLACRERLGIEANDRSRQDCRKTGVRAVATIDDVPDHWADVLISHHALEHVAAPYEALMKLRRKVRPGGRVVFVVPCESVHVQYDPEDPHRHLFTWNPLNLANLFKCAGYRVLSARPYFHRWPPKGWLLQRWFGWKVFHALSSVYGRCFTRLSHSMVVAAPTGDGG